MSTGVPRLDAMLGDAGSVPADGGYYKGSTVLVNGTAGTGKSTLAAQFCDATCRRGERALYFAFEESQAEIVRNMSSVGIDLQQAIDANLLRFECFRPSVLGLEGHLFAMQRSVNEFDPAVVVMDSGLRLPADRIGRGRLGDAHPTGRLPQGPGRHGDVHEPELRGQPGRGRPADRIPRGYVAAREDHGGQRRAQPAAVRAQVTRHRALQSDPRVRPHASGDRARRYVGPQGVLTGTARQAQEALERSDGTARLEELEQRRTNLARRREAVLAQTAALWREFEDEADIVGQLLSHGSSGAEDRAGQRAEQGRMRGADAKKPASDDGADAFALDGDT
jgi:circadian clock protein KaiC